MKKIPLVLLGLFLSACSLIPESPPLPMYSLGGAENVEVQVTAVAESIIVDRPQAPGRMDSKRIVLKGPGFREDVIANGQWADSLTKLLQDQLIAAFDNTRVVKAASRPDAGVASGFALQSTVQDFSGTLDGKNAVNIHMNIRLLDTASRQVLATETIRITRPVNNPSVEGVVGAFNEALTEALAKTVTWSVTQMKVKR